MINIRRLSKSDINVCTALEVNAVVEAAFGENRNPAGEQKNRAQRIEILSFAHPVDIGLFEELYHAGSASFP